MNSRNHLSRSGDVLRVALALATSFALPASADTLAINAIQPQIIVAGSSTFTLRVTGGGLWPILHSSRPNGFFSTVLTGRIRSSSKQCESLCTGHFTIGPPRFPKGVRT